MATETERDAQGDLVREAAYGWGPGDETLLKATVTRPNAPLVEIEYEYDEAETLIARRVVRGGAEEEHVRYLVDRVNPSGYSQVLAEVDGATGAPLRSYTYGEKLRGESAADGSGTFSHLGDALTSTRALTSGGAVAEKKDYTAFGTPLAGNSSLTPYAFTGQRRDAETGLQYHRARWLHTGTGTWASQDPVFDFPGNFGHSFLYASASPIASVDINGEWVVVALLAVAAIVAILSIIGLPAAKAYLNTGGSWSAAGRGASDASAALFTGLWLLTKQAFAAHIQGRGPEFIFFFIQGLVSGTIEEIADYGATMGEAWEQKRYGLAVFLGLLLIAAFIPSPDDIPRIAAKSASTVGRKAATNGARETVEALARRAGKNATLEDMAQFRKEIGLPSVAEEKALKKQNPKFQRTVIAKLEINSKEYWGWSAHKQGLVDGYYSHTPFKVNFTTAGHAEGDVFIQAAMDNQFGAKRARMVVDEVLCDSCGKYAGVRSLMKDLGLEELEVVTPSGSQIIKAPK